VTSRLGPVGWLVLLAVLLGAAPASGFVVDRVTVDPRVLGPRIPASFWSYSMEIDQLKGALGDGDARGPAAPLARLFRDLGAAGNGVPALRLGGGTQDNAYWNPGGFPRPEGQKYGIDVPTLVGIDRFAAASGSKVLFGLNLLAGDPRIPIDEALAVEQLVARRHLLGFELGNEPDFYAKRPFGTPDGRRGRPASYGPAAHRAEFADVRRAMRAAGVRSPVAGPGNVGRPEWTRALPAFVRAQGGDLAMATGHEYPFTACTDPGGIQLPHPGVLLEDGVVTNAARKTIEVVRRLRGLPFRMTETNSVSCGGLPGASDRMVAALWGLDHAFSQMLAGARAVHFHAALAAYRPWTSGYIDGAWRVSPAALLPAHFAFSTAAPAGGRLLPSTYFGQRPGRGANVKTWGTLSRDRRTVRVLVLYKAGTRRGTVRVRVPGARGRPTVERLEAAGPLSDGTTVRWRGQVLPLRSATGRLEGRRRIQRLRVGRRGNLAFAMRPYTAALLTVRVR
jgi:hypothetical protein